MAMKTRFVCEDVIRSLNVIIAEKIRLINGQFGSIDESGTPDCPDFYIDVEFDEPSLTDRQKSVFMEIVKLCRCSIGGDPDEIPINVVARCNPEYFTDETSKADCVLLQNVTAGYVGDCLLFWKTGGCGYTADVDDAQRFTAKEANAIIGGSVGTHSWKLWPESEVINACHRVVSREDLPQKL